MHCLIHLYLHSSLTSHNPIHPHRRRLKLLVLHSVHKNFYPSKSPTSLPFHDILNPPAFRPVSFPVTRLTNAHVNATAPISKAAPPNSMLFAMFTTENNAHDKNTLPLLRLMLYGRFGKRDETLLTNKNARKFECISIQKPRHSNRRYARKVTR